MLCASVQAAIFFERAHTPPLSRSPQHRSRSLSLSRYPPGVRNENGKEFITANQLIT